MMVYLYRTVPVPSLYRTVPYVHTHYNVHVRVEPVRTALYEYSTCTSTTTITVLVLVRGIDHSPICTNTGTSTVVPPHRTSVVQT